MNRERYIVLGVGVALLGVIAVFFFPGTKPWEASGRLILAVHTVPGLALESQGSLGFGIDAIELYTAQGDTKKITILTRRVTLDQNNDVLEIIVDTSVPAGSYSGFSFTLKSPELRNNWQEEVAPTPVVLKNEFVQLTKTAFHIEENKTTALVLGFETLQAIHDNGNQKTYLPVVQAEARFGTEPTTVEGRTVIQGGTIESNATYGMDWDGLMRFNFRAKAQNVESSETKNVPQDVLESTIEIPDNTLASTTDVTSNNATTSSSTSSVNVEMESIQE